MVTHGDCDILPTTGAKLTGSETEVAEGLIGAEVKGGERSRIGALRRKVPTFMRTYRYQADSSMSLAEPGIDADNARDGSPSTRRLT